MKISIVTSGELFRIEGVRSFDSAILETMSRTERKFLMALYVLRPEPEEFWNNLRKMADDGVEIKIVLDGSIEHDPVAVSRLKELEKNHDFFEWKFFREKGRLHAKLVISDSKRAIIGSANITSAGLFTNHEIGVLIEDKELAWTVEKLFMQLWNNL